MALVLSFAPREQTIADRPTITSTRTVLVQFGSPMKYLANIGDSDPGLAWTAEQFDDTLWQGGTYGVGYERNPPGAIALIRTAVPAGSFSVYTRTRFTLDSLSQVERVALGADYDDGYVAWINGVEVARSPEMPGDDPDWNTHAASHESSNGSAPDYGPLLDITAAALPALHAGVNVLAIGVWNDSAPLSADLLLVPTLVLNPTVSVTRGPYLQSGAPTGVVVRWRTNVATGSRVRYGLDPASLDAFADAAALSTEHEVALTGLAPRTRYYYAIGTAGEVLAGGTPEFTFVTSPEGGTPVPTRIWVIGDSGTADAAARTVRDAYEEFARGAPPDLWLMLGDNAYPDGTDAEYQAAVFDMYPKTLRQTVLWPTLGNHDGHTADSATQSGPYYNLFTLPRHGEAGGLPSGTEAYYSFDFGNIHFICLDSYETDRSPAGAMMTWLQQDVLSTDMDWIIAFWHHPPYSKGSHDSDTEVELYEMRQNALPLLEDGGVDLVLTGHSHDYERSYLLDGHYGPSWTLTEAMKQDGGDGRIDGDGSYKKPTGGPAPREGAVYIVAGSSGQTSGGLLNHPAMYVSLGTLGSLVLDVHGRELNARFLDNTGVFRDYFTLVKGPVTPPVADFSAAPTLGTAPLAVQFADLSLHDPSLWSWDFDGNGTTDSHERNPAHQYTSAGLYTVGLTAYSAGGKSSAVKPALICATSADGLADADGDGIMDGADVCPCAPDPRQEDADHDGKGDACDRCPSDPRDDADGDGFCADFDTCPTISNPDQNPEACHQEVIDIAIDFKSPLGKGSGLVTWRTTHEVDLVGFNVVTLDPHGERIQQNLDLLTCEACTTGAPASYSFIFPKHRGGHAIFIEAIRQGGAVETYGPAIRKPW